MLRRDLIRYLLAMALPLPAAAATPTSHIRMGIHPYNSTLALLSTHRPLISWLQKLLGREIEFITASNFEAYLGSLLNAEYDLVIAPPHFAVLANRKAGYHPLYQYRTRLDPLLVVRNNSRIQSARDFRGTRIAMADPTSLIRLAIVLWFEEHQLIAGRDYQIVERPTHGASAAATALGEVDAGITTSSGLAQIPSDIRQQIRSVNTGIRLPHLVTLAHPRIGESAMNLLRQSLPDLIHSPEGEEFFRRMPVKGYETFTSSDIALMEPYLRLLMPLISHSPPQTP
jgi:phosphonate transport system substrate-binding protein